MRAARLVWVNLLLALALLVTCHRESDKKDKAQKEKHEGDKRENKNNQHFNTDYPDVFLIGAMKSGTTSLSDLMHKNSAFCSYGEKEKHFFNGADYKNEHAIAVATYKAEFDLCPKGTLKLDATPGYSEKANVNERMKETYPPEVLARKFFIFIMREPITRHHSEYEMDLRFCLDTIGDLNRSDQASWRIYRHERACESVMHGDFNPLTNDPAKHTAAKYMGFHDWCMSPRGRRELSRGHYKETILRFLAMVRRDKFFIINFESLVTNTAQEMMGLSTFLGLQDAQRWNGSIALPKQKKSGANMHDPNMTTMSCVTVRMLDKYFRRVNGGEISAWVRAMSVNSAAPGEVNFAPFATAPLRTCVEDNLTDSRVANFTEDSILFSVNNNEDQLPVKITTKKPKETTESSEPPDDRRGVMRRGLRGDIKEGEEENFGAKQATGKKKKFAIHRLTIPNIFLIGAMKAGTTSVTSLMRTNPAICDFGEKEKHFFSGGDYDSKYQASVDRYIAEFAGCKEGQLTIDATPSYSVDPRVIPRMLEHYDAKTLDTMKFIFILREPISRHYSEYQMSIRLCYDADGDLKRGNFMQWRVYRHERSCEDVMTDFVPNENDPSMPNSTARVMNFHQWCLSLVGRKELRRGLYKEVIERFLTMVRRDQILMINFDTLIQNTSAVMSGLNDFLELEDKLRWNETIRLPVPGKLAKRPHLDTYMDCTTVQMLDQFFKEAEGDFFGWLQNNVTVQTRFRKPKGELDFLHYTSNPYANCVKNYHWSGNWSSSNYWNESSNTYPRETWTFVEDSNKVIRKAAALTAEHDEKMKRSRGDDERHVYHI